MAIKNILVFLCVVALFSCSTENSNVVFVSTSDELTSSIENAQPGDQIVLANGVWNDVEIKFSTSGTSDNPIILMAETDGEVFIEGKSFIKFGANHIHVSGLYFRNGFTPSNAIIEFKLNEQVANNCVVSNCVIDNFNQLQRDRQDHWVEFWGRYNELSNCNIIGKSNSGPTIRIQLKGNESIRNYHKIVNNHFGPRPRKGGPRGETMQIGDSGTSMSPSNTFVAYNLFERCNGEVEVISSKTNYNEFRNNIFYKCEGSLVMRHGNYCMIEGNYFIGDDNSDNIGGIRIVNTGHWVVNNYFYNLKGNNFRSALAVMNGIPKSPLNRYNQVTDVVVAYNTWVNCTSPWQFGVGTNISQKDVLPASEIRSARPVRTVLANNVIYNETGDKNPIIAYDKTDGIKFKSNVINNQGQKFPEQNGLKNYSFEMTKISDNIFVPSSEISQIEPYKGFDFETILFDLLGNVRSENNWIGAVSEASNEDPNILDKSKYGAEWFSVKEPNENVSILTASALAGDLATKITEAKNGDIIELDGEMFEINTPLTIDKNITIRSKNKNTKSQIVYSGKDETPVFELHPKGNLYLQNVKLSGTAKQYAFANLKENMSSLYNLKVEDCEISNFYYVLKAYKETFSDEITFDHSLIKNCENGIELSEETNDKGDYNVEFLTIDACSFTNVKSNVIDYYRGGYDESTIGGNLKVTNSTFTNCGAKESSKILLNHRGIINVEISNNTFKNNPVKLVALLWGAKNNSHSDNKLTNSGKIVVQENIKLSLMY